MLLRCAFSLLLLFRSPLALAARIRWLGLLLLGGLPWGALSAVAQAGTAAVQARVSGTVSEAGTTHALAGVAVRVRRARQGAVTSAQGAFLATASPTDTLLFQALGYKPYQLSLRSLSRSHRLVQVHLHEVLISADGGDRARVNRALRNVNRAGAPLLKGPQLPKTTPLFEVDSIPPTASLRCGDHRLGL